MAVRNDIQALTPNPVIAPLIRMLSRLDRRKVEAFAEVSIALLDIIDGDSDIEQNGDELDFDGSEDCFAIETSILENLYNGAGCIISDPDCAVDDSRCDPDEGI